MSLKGDKLWFRAFDNHLMEVDVTLGKTVSVSDPRPLFKGDPISVDLTLGYAVVGNGERFIAARRLLLDPDGCHANITVVLAEFATEDQHFLIALEYQPEDRRALQSGSPARSI